MAHSDANRPTLRPAVHYPAHSIQPVTLPLESEPPGGDVAGEDFLYHLSRGSELLKDDRVEQAKEALELALSLQPMDLRGQGLLGVVYFRLGLYPLAIDIYRHIVDIYDDEVAPKVNLALCYVKTGQQHAARELLEDVVRRDPDHHRAWAYLGLVFQFHRDFAKAEAAFERAGQHGMADRMRQLAEHAATSIEESFVAPERWELRAAAEDAFGELETKTTPFHIDESTGSAASAMLGRWRATEPGEVNIPTPDRPARRPSTPPPSRRPSTPPETSIPATFRPPPLPELPTLDSLSDATSPTRVVRHAATTSAPPTRVMGQAASSSTRASDALTAGAFPAFMPRVPSHCRDWLIERSPAARGDQVVVLDARTFLVELREPFAVRANTVLAISPSDAAKREMRVDCRSRAGAHAESLGGAQIPIIGFFGPGRLLARATSGVVELFDLDDESVTLTRSALMGLSLGLRYEVDRVKFGRNESVDVVHVSGRGTVALQLPAAAMTLDSVANGLVVRLAELVGWTARVLPEVIDPAEAPGRARGFVALRGEGIAIVV